MKLTPSQIVNIVLLFCTVIAAPAINSLQQHGVHVDPIYVAVMGAIVASVTGACRSWLSNASGTSTGVPNGPDVKSQEVNK